MAAFLPLSPRGSFSTVRHKPRDEQTANTIFSEAKRKQVVAFHKEVRTDADLVSTSE